MKICIQAQRMTCVEFDQTPKQKTINISQLHTQRPTSNFLRSTQNTVTAKLCSKSCVHKPMGQLDKPQATAAGDHYSHLPGAPLFCGAQRLTHWMSNIKPYSTTTCWQSNTKLNRSVTVAIKIKTMQHHFKQETSPLTCMQKPILQNTQQPALYLHTKNQELQKPPPRVNHNQNFRHNLDDSPNKNSKQRTNNFSTGYKPLPRDLVSTGAQATAGFFRKEQD